MDQENRAPGTAAEEKKCSSCGSALRCIQERFSLGGDGWGLWTAMLSDQIEVSAYACPQCGKLEFYCVQEETEDLVTCPECGTQHSGQINCPTCLMRKGPNFFASRWGKDPEKKKKGPDRDPWDQE